MDVVEKPTRRAAAKKASRLAAEQLEDSSDDENMVPPLGASAAQRAQTPTRQRRIQALAKSDSLPSPASGSHQRPASSRHRSQTVSSGLEGRMQSRKPPAQASAQAGAQYISSSSDSDIVILDGPPPLPRKQAPRRKRSSLGQGESHNENHSKKRKCGDANGGSSSAGGPVTPLSSPPPEAGPANASGSRDRTRLADTRAQPSREQRPMSLSPQYRRAAAAGASRSEYDTLDWDEDVVLVFVRVDQSGAPAEAGEAMWWPAQVVHRGIPVRVALFGRHPAWPPKAPIRELSLPSRSPALILPYRTGPTQLRFNEATFGSGGRGIDATVSPRKKRNTAEAELVTRWCEARDLMLKAHQDAHDGMPLLLSRYISSMASSPGVPGINLDSSEDEDAEMVSFRSRTENVFYDIPGELILARERRNDTQYWPAKLMKYFPPTKPSDKPLYEVLFFDGTVKKLPDNTDMFYTPMHDGFKTCKLGEAEDDYDINDGARDGDNEVDLRAVDCDEEPEEQLRAGSPPPTLPAPTAFGHELTIHEQFEYVKPVLSAVLSGRHQPTLERHIAFMRGGRSRTQVSNTAWKRGEVSHQDRDELSRCILRWMRRRQRRQELGLVPADVGVVQLALDEECPGQSTTAPGEADPEAFAGDTESAPSEPEMPPLSFVTVPSTRADSEPADDAPQRANLTALDQSVDDIDMGEDASNQLDATTGDEDRKDPGAAEPLPTYAMLSPLNQITYCTSVLLPEAILQILLWRNGHRLTTELLSPGEEARLHRIAEENADATYWVHDIIHMKRSVDRKTLPSSAPVQPERAASGRLRTRRR